MHRRASRRGRLWIPYSDNAVAFAAAFVVLLAIGIYLRTMLPSTGFWDTGEAQTVPPTLSIFHPTGFPTYTMLGWLWSQLPIGEVAWRMNLLSGVCVALASGFVVLISGQLIGERDRALRATAAGIAGAAFAFASEPWENATRADVHAVSILSVSVVLWLLLTWRAAERAGSPRAGGWLVGAALAFGLGLGVHPIIGLFAFGIVAWLFVVDRRFLAAMAADRAVRRGRRARHRLVRLHLAARHHRSGAAALLRPPGHLGALPLPRASPSSSATSSATSGNPSPSWPRSGPTPSACWPPSSWRPAGCWSPSAPAVVAARSLGTFAVLLLFVIVNVAYSMNFRDGDIDRYYMPTVAVLPRCSESPWPPSRGVRARDGEVGRRLVTSRRGASRRWLRSRARWCSGSGRCCRRPRW